MSREECRRKPRHERVTPIKKFGRFCWQRWPLRAHVSWSIHLEWKKWLDCGKLSLKEAWTGYLLEFCCRSIKLCTNLTVVRIRNQEMIVSLKRLFESAVSQTSNFMVAISFISHFARIGDHERSHARSIIEFSSVRKQRKISIAPRLSGWWNLMVEIHCPKLRGNNMIWMFYVYLDYSSDDHRHRVIW